jgi:hypothetical protein
MERVLNRAYYNQHLVNRGFTTALDVLGAAIDYANTHGADVDIVDTTIGNGYLEFSDHELTDCERIMYDSLTEMYELRGI